ncbi:MAG: hypothetical protein WCO26_21370 [Deltaproteobacteria bacterium]
MLPPLLFPDLLFLGEEPLQELALLDREAARIGQKFEETPEIR